jgi:hypothetical protein
MMKHQVPLPRWIFYQSDFMFLKVARPPSSITFNTMGEYFGNFLKHCVAAVYSEAVAWGSCALSFNKIKVLIGNVLALKMPLLS